MVKVELSASAQSESVAQWAQRMATAAPPMGLDALGVVTATLREVAEQRVASKTAA